MADYRNPDNWPVESSAVKSVNYHDDGSASITQESGWTFFISSKELDAVGVNPEVGEEVIVLGGLGFSIRGIFIGGREYRYVTREQADQEREEWLANYRREKEERFYTNIGDYIKRKNAMGTPFRERMDRFANKNGFKEFWTEDGGYELLCVEQADKLYKLASEVSDENAVEWLNIFSEASWEEQKRLFPDLDEGHSGNTFGAMVGLARAVAMGRDI